MIPFEQQALAGEMHDELQQQRLIVAKVRTDSGYIRVSVTQNPEWYQQLCADHMGSRKRYPKSRTIIRRVDTLRTLRQIANGDRRETLYQQRLFDVLQREANRRN